MNMLGKEPSYRRSSKLADLKQNFDNGKRIFGRDITNIERKNKKNVSIYDKIPMKKFQHRPRSYSVSGPKDRFVPQKGKDAIIQYRQDVIDFMVHLQKSQSQEKQSQITLKMKQILIDWLIDVHDSFQLKEQTLHLALDYLNEYSSKRQINKDQYQLVGITCLWIASKYEEIYPPRTKNYIEVTAGTYSLKEMKYMEGKIIQTLDFNLNRTTSLQLLEAAGTQLHEKNTAMCKFILQLGLFQGIAKKYLPFTRVSAAISLADSIYKTKSKFELQPSNKPVTDQVRQCYKEMASLLQGSNKYELKAIRRKFTKSKYHCVGKKFLSLSQ